MNKNLLAALGTCYLLTLFLAVSCKPGGHQAAKKEKQSQPYVNSYAKRFTIEQREGYSQIIITNPWQGAGGVVQEWYLVPEGNKPPADASAEQIIRVPVKRIVCMSTTHLAMLAALKEFDPLMGFSGVNYIYNTEFIRRVEEGSIKDVGYEDNLNKEMVLRLKPDIVIAYGVGAESAGYVAKLRELGIRVMFDADYLEEHPLGKTEWIRVFGALFSRQQMADSIFTSVVKRYSAISELAGREAGTKPKVLLGLPFRDTWYISPGNSYVSRLIADAGGNYLWSGTSSAFSMPVSIESVFVKALEADFWLNAGTVTSEADIAAIDSRFTSLPVFTNKHIYNNNKRISSNGGNDYWEGGCMNPDVILKDVASILHPGLFPGRELFYYRKIE